MAGRAEKRDSLYFVPMELSGSTGDGRSLLHARAEVVLATKVSGRLTRENIVQSAEISLRLAASDSTVAFVEIPVGTPLAFSAARARSR